MPNDHTDHRFTGHVKARKFLQKFNLTNISENEMMSQIRWKSSTVLLIFAKSLICVLVLSLNYSILQDYLLTGLLALFTLGSCFPSSSIILAMFGEEFDLCNPRFFSLGSSCSLAMYVPLDC